MAAGLPVASANIGNVWSMVSGPNRELRMSDRGELKPALVILAEDSDLRRTIGRANREKAVRGI